MFHEWLDPQGYINRVMERNLEVIKLNKKKSETERKKCVRRSRK